MDILSIHTPQTKVKAYIELMKPRIVLLLLFTMLTSMVVAVDGLPSSRITMISLIAGGMAAGGASALNHYFDRDIDAKMSRTARRPIPSGRLKARNALIFGSVLVLLSLLIFATQVNLLTAFLVMIGEFYYLLLYTLILKRNSSINIVIGGGAGALPCLIGWSATTGTLSTGAWLLFLIVFYWTPPHSWALALLVNKDYERAGIPMMPVVRGDTATKVQIVLYSALLMTVTLFPVVVNQLGTIYFLIAIAMGIGFFIASIRLLKTSGKAMARRVYKYSTAYLAFLFIAMVIDRLIPL